jgi:hypothetical protein
MHHAHPNKNMLTELKDASIEIILKMGLHNYLKLFLERINPRWFWSQPRLSYLN